MPVGPTAGPIGGPPEALPPLTRAFTITFPFSLTYTHRLNLKIYVKKISKNI
jgi:hypothetical protein